MATGAEYGADGCSAVHFDIRAGIDLYMLYADVSGATVTGAGGSEVENATSGCVLRTCSFETAVAESMGWF